MSVARRIAFGVGALWANRVIGVLLGLVLIPVLFDALPEEELGLWFLLAQAGAFVGLLDFGFNVTLTRRIAQVHARLEAASGGGDPEAAVLTAHMHDLVRTGRVLFRWIFLAVLVVGLGAGYVFLAALDLTEVPLTHLFTAWAVLCAAYAVTSGTGFEHAVLNGAGHVGWDAIVSSSTTVLTALAQIVVALLGGGLFELALVTTGGAVLGRIAAALLVRRMVPEVRDPTGRFRGELVTGMSGLAVRAWLTGLGAFLILKTDQYFIAYFEGAADIPAYHAAYVLVLNCWQLAVAFAAATSVYVSRLWSTGDIAGVHRLVWRSVRLGLGLMVCGIAFLLVCGPALFDVWLGPGRFVGMPVLATFCVMFTLEAQHVILAQSCRALEVEAFAPWALGAGALNLVLSWILIGPLGLLGVALATLLAQLATNNWYAVFRSLRELRMGLGAYVRRAVLPMLGLLAAAVLACWGAAHVGSGAAGEVGTVVAGALAAGVVLVLFWWCIALDASERRGVVARVLRR